MICCSSESIASYCNGICIILGSLVPSWVPLKWASKRDHPQSTNIAATALDTLARMYFRRTERREAGTWKIFELNMGQFVPPSHKNVQQTRCPDKLVAAAQRCGIEAQLNYSEEQFGASAYLQASSSEPIRCMYVSGITISALGTTHEAPRQTTRLPRSASRHPYMCGTQKREQAASCASNILEKKSSV